MTATAAPPAAAPGPLSPACPPPARRSSRLHGLDLARAVAVLAMFTVHLGAPLAAVFPRTGSVVEAAAHGRSSALFAVLAGVALALLSGRTRRPAGADLARARRRIAVRAAVLVTVGWSLIALDTPVAVIIAHYGGFLLLALPLLGARPGVVAGAAAAGAVLLPAVSFGVRAWASGAGAESAAALLAAGPVGGFLFTGMFPAAAFLPYVLAGLALGRCDLARARVRLAAVAGGLVCAAAGYGGSALVLAVAPGPVADAVGARPYLHGAVPVESGWWLATAVPHSGTVFELVGSGGVAVAAVGVCLFAADRWPRASAPLAAVGALSLTVYAVHVLGIWAVRGAGVAQWPVWAEVFAAAAVAGAFAWRRRRGRGPLEGAVSAVVRRAVPGPGAVRGGAGWPLPDSGDAGAFAAGGGGRA